MIADIDKPFGTVKKALGVCYVLPTEEDGNNLRKFYFRSVLARSGTLFLVVLGAILHFVKITKDKVKEIDTSEDVVVLSAGFGTMLILGRTTCIHKNWEKLMEDLIDFSKYGKPDNIDEHFRFHNKWSSWFGSYYIVGCVLYGLVTMREIPYCNKISEERNLHLICDTFVPLWIPFEVPHYGQYVIFVGQFILIVTDVFPAAMLVYMTFECTEVLGLHFEFLKKHFQLITKDKNIRHRPDGIGYWVRYHNHIMSMSVNLKGLAKQTVAYITLVSAMVFACAENQIIRQIKPLGASLFFIGWMVATFLLCHTGQRMMDFILDVHDAVVYKSDWHLTDNETRRDIVFILLRCQKPLSLDALPLGAINYSLFVLLLKTSYSYLTLLNETV